MRRWGGGLLHSTGEEEDNEGLEEEEEEEEEYILVSHEKKATALSVAIGKGSVDIEMLMAHGACAQPSNAKEPITFSF